ncbi:putative RTX toxins and related Ca2+-binding protein [Ruegeria lacuscaerulensis ITI-1157]|nr:putative RTX toxins and related Ca2+-binding protein [Ruegeria lacuscaerulensis ITI-1157]SHK06454.1 hypothetical protein SAMN05444404_3224 [Ruegeria lacuscaerulensis ITI-1157]
MAAPTIDASLFAGNFGSSSTISLPTHSAGDLLIEVFQRQNTVAPDTTPADDGWTLRYSDQSKTNTSFFTHSKTAGASEAATGYSFTDSNKQQAWGVLAISGHNGVDDIQGDVTGFTSTVNVPSATASAADSLSVIAIGHSDNDTVTTSPSGYTLIGEEVRGAATVQVWAKTVGAGATGTQQFTYSGNSFYVAAHYIIAPAVGGGSIVSGDGASTGTSTATGAGSSVAEADGVAGGTATASGSGQSTAESSGTSGGTSGATGQGQIGGSVAEGDGSSSGASTASGAGEATASGDGAASGASSGAGEGYATATGDGSSAGASTASGQGETAGESVGQSDGTSSATGDGQSTAEADGSSGGAATTSGQGAAVAEGQGASAGSSTASGVGSDATENVGQSDGSSTATGEGQATSEGVGTSGGSGAATGDGAATVEADGSSGGSSAATGQGQSSGGNLSRGRVALPADSKNIGVVLNPNNICRKI